MLPVRDVAEVAVDEQLEVAADRGQRGAQLVADGRHEVGLLPVQLGEPTHLLVLHLRQPQRHDRLGGDGGALLGRLDLVAVPASRRADHHDGQDAEAAAAGADGQHEQAPGPGRPVEGAGPFVVVGLVRQQVSDVEEAGVATQLVVDGPDLLGQRPRQRRQVGQVSGVPLEAVLDGLAVVGEGVEQHAVGAETGAELGRDALERLVDVDGRADGATDVEDELLHLEHGRLLVDEPGIGTGEVVEVAREHANLEGALLLVGHRDDVLLRLATHHLPEPRERAPDGAVHPEAGGDEHEDHRCRDGGDDTGRDGRGLARVERAASRWVWMLEPSDSFVERKRAYAAAGPARSAAVAALPAESPRRDWRAATNQSSTAARSSETSRE